MEPEEAGTARGVFLRGRVCQMEDVWAAVMSKKIFGSGINRFCYD